MKNILILIILTISIGISCNSPSNTESTASKSLTTEEGKPIVNIIDENDIEKEIGFKIPKEWKLTTGGEYNNIVNTQFESNSTLDEIQSYIQSQLDKKIGTEFDRVEGKIKNQPAWEMKEFGNGMKLKNANYIYTDMISAINIDLLERPGKPIVIAIGKSQKYKKNPDEK